MRQGYGTSFEAVFQNSTKVKAKQLMNNNSNKRGNIPLINNPKYIPYALNVLQFEKFVDWRQCAAVMQSEAVTFMPSCSGGCNLVVA
jgi:hypothetical protein